MLDFVARDRRQNAVRDLHPEEIQVFEDGVRQIIKSFHYRDGSEPNSRRPTTEAPAATGPTSAEFDPLREISLVSVVFQSMGPESRRRATQFVHEFLAGEIPQNTWFGVFALNRQLSALQPYTVNMKLVQAAVDRAATGSYQQFAKESQDSLAKINEWLATSHAKDQFHPLDPGSASENGPPADPLLAAALARTAEITLKIFINRKDPARSTPCVVWSGHRHSFPAARQCFTSLKAS